MEGLSYPSRTMPYYTPSEIEHILTLIQQYQTTSPERILLGKGAMSREERTLVALQLSARVSLSRRLPRWAEVGAFVPSSLALEQCSSEEAAEYKRRFVREDDRLLDLTGGMGVDFAALRAVAAHGVYVERHEELASVAAYNLPRLLPTQPSEVICGESLELLPELLERYKPSLIYLDPARREGHDPHRRVYAIEDCEPDLRELLPRLRLLYTSLGHPLPRLLVKLSPMLDITHTLQSVPYVTELHVVAVRGEVKELLLSLDLSLEEAMPEAGAVTITAANLLGSERPTQTFTQPRALAHEGELTASYATELSTYLYEPNAALMKSGLFKTLAETFALQPLHPSTHLYTSSHWVMDFPGRVFEVRAVHPFASSTLRRLGRELGAAQISCRNFPLSPEALRAKLGIKDSDTQTLFALTLSPSIPLMVLCHRL